MSVGGDVGAYNANYHAICKANPQSTDLYRYVRVTAKNIKDCYKLLQFSGVEIVDKCFRWYILEPSTTNGAHTMHNITTMSHKAIQHFIKPRDCVSNGSDVCRYIGTTKRGVHVVAWSDKRTDFDTVEKLTQYLANNSGE